MMRFFHSVGGSLLCAEQALPSWKPLAKSEDDSWYPYFLNLPGEVPDVLYFVAESMSVETARLIATNLGGYLEVRTT